MLKKHFKEAVLITGSSRGLGAALALVFAKNGWDVILHGRNRKALNQMKKRISVLGVNANIVIGDLRRPKVLENLYLIAEAKKVSVLVNNASVDFLSTLENISESKINEILNTNLSALIKLTRKIYPLFLKNKKGAIIIINSISGLEPQEQRSIYCASKWGLKGFTDAFRLEARKNQVRGIGVYPSRIKTRPEFKYGLESETVARKIYSTYLRNNRDDLIIDNRLAKKN